MAAVAARMTVLRDARRRRGDWNIGHTENAIKAWKANQKKAGFLPAERQWVTDLLATGWVGRGPGDASRRRGPYSWWSWRGKAFDNDGVAHRGTISWPTRRWPTRSSPPGWSATSSTRCAGPITPR